MCENTWVGGEPITVENKAIHKIIKMQILQQADKETIDVQQKKLHVVRSELQQMKISYKNLKKNYEQVSVHVANNAKDMEKVKEMRENFEKTIDELAAAKLSLENELETTKKKLSESKNKCKLRDIKIKALEKEI